MDIEDLRFQQEGSRSTKRLNGNFKWLIFNDPCLNGKFKWENNCLKFKAIQFRLFVFWRLNWHVDTFVFTWRNKLAWMGWNMWNQSLKRRTWQKLSLRWSTHDLCDVQLGIMDFQKASFVLSVVESFTFNKNRNHDPKLIKVLIIIRSQWKSTFYSRLGWRPTISAIYFCDFVPDTPKNILPIVCTQDQQGMSMSQMTLVILPRRSHARSCCIHTLMILLPKPWLGCSIALYTCVCFKWF